MPARTIYLIKRLEAAIRLMLEKELGDLDLTPAQYTTLSMLAANGETSSSDLARRVLVTPQSMSEMIKALDRKGLIKRRESETNRKVLDIALSPAGRALLEKAEARVDGLEVALFSPLERNEVDRLREILSVVLSQDRAARRKAPGRPARGLTPLSAIYIRIPDMLILSGFRRFSWWSQTDEAGVRRRGAVLHGRGTAVRALEPRC